ncbi:adenylosuccinate lyase [Bradyrhizobium sp. F1.13.4]
MLSFEPGTVFSSRHLADIFSTAPMRTIFSERNSLESMLLVEVALAKVQGQLGVIPAEAAAAIASAARTELLDLNELAAGTLRAGLPVVNLVEQLIRLTGEPHGEFVHWGATSQDIMDTALVMQIRDALELIHRDLERLISTLADLARTHRDTPMVGRTKLQHAIPITFGFKVSVLAVGPAAPQATARRTQTKGPAGPVRRCGRHVRIARG